MEATAEGPVSASILADTQVVRDSVEPSRFAAHIGESWRVVDAFGGVTLAVALRAMNQAVGDERFRPLAATAVFCRGVPCGPVTIDVDVLRAGRTAAQATADVRGAASDDVGLRVTAVFGPDAPENSQRIGWLFPTWVPAAEECTPVDSSIWGKIPLFQQTDWREVESPTPDLPPGVCARALEWERFLRPPILPDGSLDLIASSTVLSDSMALVIGKIIDLKAELMNPVTLDLSVQFFGKPRSDWMLRDSYLYYLSERYAYGTTVVWDRHGTLLAVAHQRAVCQSLRSHQRSQLGW